jgi:DNA-directed RNA polymerase specialized sigma24 family protein
VELSMPQENARGEGGGSQGDRTLLLRVQRGDEVAQAQSSPELARRVDPDDLVQSIFRTFFRRAAKGEYDVPEGEELWKLLLVIGLNKIRAAGAHHRAARRDVRQTVSLHEQGPGAAGKHAADEEARLVLRTLIDELLHDMPATRRQIIEQRIEGCEVAEIAAKTQRSKRSVERILQEFRTTLRSLLQVED